MILHHKQCRTFSHFNSIKCRFLLVFVIAWTQLLIQNFFWLAKENWWGHVLVFPSIYVSMCNIPLTIPGRRMSFFHHLGWHYPLHGNNNYGNSCKVLSAIKNLWPNMMLEVRRYSSWPHSVASLVKMAWSVKPLQ